MILPSVLDVLKPAVGPSSSHTLGPLRAAEDFLARIDGVPGGRIEVVLYGSLAQTGRGHLTDVAIAAGLGGYRMNEASDRTIRTVHDAVSESRCILAGDRTIAFAPSRDIRFDPSFAGVPHPNTLRFTLRNQRGEITLSRVYLSVGGGRVVGVSSVKGGRRSGVKAVSMKHVIETCRRRRLSLADWVLDAEHTGFGHSRATLMFSMADLWHRMRSSVRAGLRHRGILPGGLGLARRAADLHDRHQGSLQASLLSDHATRASIYAIAVAEENAAGGAVVTAPTCGSSGVVPACLLAVQELRDLDDSRIHEALLVAGLVGAAAIAKASIAGALVGCQGEIGVASAMAAAAACFLLGGDVEAQIDRAAETALEHYLGLTCDPVGGLAQIPCIQRIDAGAVSALHAAALALLSGGRDRVSFDATLEAMHRTGLDMPSQYKETALGGLAAIPDLDRDGIPDLETHGTSH